MTNRPEHATDRLHDPTHDTTDARASLDRRAALRRLGVGGAAAGAAVWLAPTVLSIDAASAATAPPPPPTLGTLSGTIGICAPQNPPPPGWTFTATATLSGGGAPTSTVVVDPYAFSLVLPAGTYDVVIERTSPPAGPQTFPGIVVPAGGIVSQYFQYDQGGC